MPAAAQVCAATVCVCVANVQPFTDCNFWIDLNSFIHFRARNLRLQLQTEHKMQTQIVVLLVWHVSC